MNKIITSWSIVFLAGMLLTQSCCCKEAQSTVSKDKKIKELLVTTEKKQAISENENQSCSCGLKISKKGKRSANNPSVIKTNENSLSEYDQVEDVMMPVIVVEPVLYERNEAAKEPATEKSVSIVANELSVPSVKEDKGKKLPLGIKSISTTLVAGPNLSMKRSAEDYGNMNHKSIPGIGYQLGVGAKIGFSDKFAVEPSLMIKHNPASEKLSYANTGGEPGASTTDKYSYTYLSVPIYANIKASEKIDILVGPEMNYLLGANVKYDGGNKESLTSNSIKLGLGLQAGLRYNLPAKSGPSGMGIQVLYDHRLSRLNEKSYSYMGGGSSSEVPAWRMSSFNLMFFADLCELLDMLREE